MRQHDMGTAGEVRASPWRRGDRGERRREQAPLHVLRGDHLFEGKPNPGGSPRKFLQETPKINIKRLGKVLIPIILAAAASSYRLSITEPIEFSEKAEQYLEKGATITVRLDRSVELLGFYHDEWYPALSELAPIINKAQNHISATQNGQPHPPFDNVAIEQTIEKLRVLRIDSSTFFFEDQTYTEFVNTISNATKDSIDLLVELVSTMMAYEGMDRSTRTGKFELLAKRTSDIVSSIRKASDLEKKIMRVQSFDKDRLEHYLDLHNRFRLGGIISHYFYWTISLLCIWILMVVLFPNISLRPSQRR